MKLKYWTGFSKRKNSTKIPTATGTEIDVYWKEDTSIDSPSVVLASNTFNIDYCYINDWGKYYFVSAIQTLTNGQVQYDLVEDTLATNKTAIGATKAMILRSSTGYNVWIPDEEVYVSTQKTLVREASATSVGFANLTGCYLLSVINEEGSATGFAAQYFCNATSLNALANDLMNSSFVADVMKYSSNVSAGIVSLKWMPFDYSDIVSASFTTLENFKVSNLTFTSSSGYRITGTSYFLDGAVTLNIPWRSDKDYRESAPFTVAKLLVPMYGMVELNTADLVGATSLYIQYRVDRSTGDVVVIINKDSAGEVIQTLQFNVAVEIPVATMTRNIGGAMSAISGGINSAIGIAAGNYIGGSVGVITSAANFALAANGRSISSRGGLDGKASTAFGDAFQLMLYVPHTLDPTNADFIATKGRPCHYVDTISNHSGYVRCMDASVDISGDNWERDEINSYLNNGFYYE